MADIATDALDLVWPKDLDLVQVDVGDGIVPIAMAGEGPPLILLHGWTLDWRMWLPQVEELSRDFCLVMPDRRGFGRSSAPPELTREADDVQRIADFMGFDKYALLGLSQGAAIALDCAHRHAWRLSCVIASGAPLPYLVDRDEVINVEQYRRWAMDGEIEKMRADWSRHELMRHENPLTGALVDTMLDDYDGRDLISPSSLNCLPKDVLAHLPIPLLAMTGSSENQWRRDCARALAQIVPHCTHHEVEGAGHLANLDNPQGFNACLREFLTKCVG